MKQNYVDHWVTMFSLFNYYLLDNLLSELSGAVGTQTQDSHKVGTYMTSINYNWLKKNTVAVNIYV